MFKFSVLAPLGVAVVAALVTQPMRATTINTLVITKNSSTSLTAILNGTTPLSVSPHGADSWTIAMPAGVGGLGHQSWAEPDAAGIFVTIDPAFPNQLDVFSGHSGAGGLPHLAPDNVNFTLSGNPLTVTFFDKSDAPKAPDTGSTAFLLGFSLVGLAFLHRKMTC